MSDNKIDISTSLVTSNPVLDLEDKLNKYGVYSVPNITVPPNSHQEFEDDALPEETEPIVPEPLIAKFSLASKALNLEAANSTQNQLDRFNKLGQKIPIDSNNKVSTLKELVAKMNEEDYSGSIPGKVFGAILSPLSWMWKRKIIEPEYFGHIRSSGRDKLLLPGIHNPWRTSDKWVSTKVPIFDAKNPIRTFGARKLLTVSRNQLAVAHRLGGTHDAGYVAFPPGRHVVKSVNYTKIDIKNIDKGRTKVGPFEVLYVKEGELGGANHRPTGTYQIFLPGKPYLLHELNYEDISTAKRTFGKFTLGPVTFMTVKDGELGGAYHKKSGKFQILPPGETYVLHSKDYDGVEIKDRTDQFKLGPYFFITVRKGFIAGAYQKIGGKFLDLPPGKTYQLNEEDYYQPKLVPRDSSIVACGPYTFLTVKKGTLNGAYRVRDGKFVEFQEEGKEYILHQEEYRDIVTKPKISYEIQQFGPNQIVTIPENHVGVFQKEGKLEIQPTGFYMLGPEYTINDNIPLKTFTVVLPQLQFPTKDGIKMAIDTNISWQVEDPQKVAVYPGTFASLSEAILNQLRLNLLNVCVTYNRAEVLPTEQDELLASGDVDVDGSSYDPEELAAKKEARYQEIANFCLTSLRETAKDGNWGIKINSVTLKGFTLMDAKIKENLQLMTQNLMAIKASKVEAKLSKERDDLHRNQKMREAETQAMIDLKESEARTAVLKKEAENEAELEKHRRIKAAEAELEESKTKSDAIVVTQSAKARADAEARKIALQIETEEQEKKAKAEATAQTLLAESEAKRALKKAEAESQAIKMMAEANFEKATKENEAASKIPEHQIRLKMAKMAVEAAEHYGHAAWKHPEELHSALERVQAYTGVPILGNAGSNPTVILDSRKKAVLTTER